MKIRFLCPLAAFIVFLSCDNGLLENRYSLELPELPPAWASVLGPPRWKIEWQNPQGQAETLEISGGEKPEITLPYSWTSAVFAWPYWPEKSIEPGIFRPAGGLFPFDAAGASLSLTWRGGVEAVLHREMGKAHARNSGASTAVPRLPWNFNWPRFRELSGDSTVNADFRADPWLADWPAIAEHIVRGGFDKRRLVPRPRSEISLPLASGPWAGTSPFAAPLFFTDTPVFPVSESADTWVCAGGLLRCNSETWIFLEWE